MAPTQGRPWEDASQLPGRGAGVPGARVGVGHQVAGAGQVAPVRLRLGVGVAAELGDGAGEQVAPGQGRPGQDAPDLFRDGDAVADQGEDLGVAGVRVVWEVPGVALGSGEVIGRVEAVGRDLRVHLRGRVIGNQRVADGRVHLRRGLVLAEVQRAQGRRDRRVGLCLCEGLGLLVAVAVDLQGVGVVLEAGAQGAREVEVPEHVGALQQLPGGRVRAPGGGVGQGHRHQGGRDGRVGLGAGVIRAEVDGGHGGRDRGVHLRSSAVGGQGRGDGRVALGRLEGRQGGRDGRRDGRVGLGHAVAVAGQAQREMVVLEADAQGRVEMEIAQGVGAQQQVPGDFSRPGLGVDQVAAPAGGQRSQLGQDRIDGALGLDVGIVAVQPGVPEAQGRVQDRLGDLAQKRGGDLLVHVRRRGLEVDRRGQVGGAGPVQERRGDFLVHVGPRLLGREVQGQLVGDGPQGVAAAHRGQGGIVGAGDGGVRGRGAAVARQLGVHGGGGGLGVHLQLQRVQRGLVGLRGQPRGEAGVQGGEADWFAAGRPRPRCSRPLRRHWCQWPRRSRPCPSAACRRSARWPAGRP